MTGSRVHQTEAIILKRKNIGETDRIVTVFSKEFGKLSCIAKGVRRITSRRSGHIEVFHQAFLSIHDSQGMLAHLTEATTIDAHENLSKDITSVSYAYYMCELVDALTPDRQKQVSVYMLLSTALSEMDSCTTMKERNETVIQFALSLLRVLGFLPADETIASTKITPFVEEIIERKLRVPRVMHLLG